MNNALISILCSDKPGLIAEISSLLFDLEINLAETSFSVLGDGAELSALCELPDGLALKEIKKYLHELPHLEKADIKIAPFHYDTEQRTINTVTHHITLYGDDQPGLVAKLTETFLDHEANVARMNTKKLAMGNKDRYIIEFWVWIPDPRIESCLATISNTASWLNMRCDWNTINYADK